MKTYKLIKTYPGSPPITDKNCSIISLGSDNYYHNNSTMYPVVIHSSSIHYYSEYWEEVIEKDYEIISFRSNSKHIKKPLFTTEDGVGIHIEEYYWFVQDGSDKRGHSTPWKTMSTKLYSYDTVNKLPKGVKRFSTRELAEDYIMYNKPFLSIVDVVQILDIDSGEEEELLTHYRMVKKGLE